MADQAVLEAAPIKTDQEKADFHLERFSELSDERQSWESEWRLITKYVFPRRSVFKDSKGKAERVGTEVYDSTGIGANNLFANGIMGFSISNMTPWFKTGLPWEAANDLPGVREWLDFAEKIIYDDLRRSNFYEEAVEILRDGGALGTAALYGEENLGTSAPAFVAIHPKEFYLDVDEYGRVDTLYRSYWVSVRALVRRFGIDACSARTKQLYNQRKLGEKIQVLHACEPRGDRDLKSISARNKKWASTYVEVADRHLIKESGYDTFPYFVLRITTNSDEKYGRGPGSDALIAIMTKNRMAKDMLRLSNKAADPGHNVPMEMRNRFDSRPGAVNYYSRPDMKAEPMSVGGDYPIALERENQIREAIEDAFFVDFFLLLQRAQQMKMTATEVMERQSEKAAIMGTLIGRIESDFLEPVIQFVFGLAAKSGRIPPPPPALIVWMAQNGKSRGQLKIEFIGPLAQAQRKFYLTQGIKAALAAVLPVAQVRPEVVDNFDWDGIVRELAAAEGMPARLISDPEIVKAIRDARMQAQQAAAQQQQALQAADMMPKLAQAPQDGSPLQQMIGRAGQLANQRMGVAA